MREDAQDDVAQRFLTLTHLLRQNDERLTPLQAGILAACGLGAASDSRHVARLLGIEHALILREVSELEAFGLIAVEKRDQRTMRTHYQLSETGEALLSAAGVSG